jgi:CRP-like cAMP-binding protein
MVMHSHPDRAVLRRAEVFAELTDADVDALAPFLAVRTLRPGEVLFQQGDAGATMVILAAGALAARVCADGGAEAELGTMAPGEVVGEMAFIDPAPRSASVVALGEATVYELAHDAMAQLRREAPGAVAAVVGAVIRDVTRRLRRIDERIEAELAQTPRGRSSAPRAITAGSLPAADVRAAVTLELGAARGRRKGEP